jgi:hypothetical protein
MFFNSSFKFISSSYIDEITVNTFNNINIPHFYPLNLLVKTLHCFALKKTYWTRHGCLLLAKADDYRCFFYLIVKMLLYLACQTKPWRSLAEREGFEPSEPHCGSTVFETAPFNHSGISPYNLSQNQILFQ